MDEIRSLCHKMAHFKLPNFDRNDKKNFTERAHISYLSSGHLKGHNRLLRYKKEFFREKVEIPNIRNKRNVITMI